MSERTWTDPDLQAEDDRYSQLYAEGYGEGPVEQLLAFAPRLQRCARILDAGCGRQGFARQLRAAGYTGKVVGVDVSRHLAEAPTGGCQVVHASLDDLPFDDGAFDGLFCCDVLEHLAPERVAPALSELARVLTPGGVWAVSVGTEPSRCRGPAGEELHLTLDDRAGWTARLAATPLGEALSSQDVERGALLRGLRGGAVLEFSDWLEATGWGRDAWLLLGKGPSFARLPQLDASGYRTLGLNHTVREAAVDVAHAIDLDVVHDLGERLLEQARAVALPWHPHVEYRAGERTLAELADEVPVLGALRDAGRLLTYDLGTWPGPHRREQPQVPGGCFSGDVVVRLLAESGVRTIRTLGIDGGERYAETFSDLTPLQNGQPSFDVQALEIAKSVAAFELDYGPLTEEPPRLTVVLVTWNAREHVRDLLAALAAYTQAPHDLVIVDNASSDGTREDLLALPRRPGLRLILNEENHQCAAATNQALETCRTEYVIYLCASHALVTEPGWEQALTGYLDARPEVGIAGDVWNPGFPLPSQRYRPGWTPEDHGVRDLQHVQGGIWIARAALLEEVGGFNAEEYPHSGTDVELSYRLLSHGHRLGSCAAVCCPPSPRLPERRPGVVAYHPASPALRAEVRRELGLEPRDPRPAVVVYCERLDNESFCASIVRELSAHYDVRPFGPGWPVRRLCDVDLTGARFYLELDAASGSFLRPQGLERLDLPKFAWLIDTHKKPGFHAQIAQDMDLTFFAMKSWGHVLPGNKAWLPVHCDAQLFKPQAAERRYDLVFVGSQTWRAEALGQIANKHGLSLHVATTTGKREKSETAALYAQARLVFNRHVTNDLNFRVVEAQACGRVLLTDAQDNGQYELFEDGRHYVLYTDERDLERQVLRYLADDEARERIEREAAEHARAHHTTQARVGQLRQAIEAYLAEHAPPRLDERQRWLVLATAPSPRVRCASYGEALGDQLKAAGHDVTLVRAGARQLPLPEGALEVGSDPVPAPQGVASRLLARAASLQATLARTAEERGPFEAVLAEGALGALVGASLARQLGVPFVFALEQCEIERRGNRLTREQLHLAELEHWGAERAAAVWVPRLGTLQAVKQHYQPARAEQRPRTQGLTLPPEPERLLAALGFGEPPWLTILTGPLAGAERAGFLVGSLPPPPPGVLLLDQAVWRLEGGRWTPLSRDPAQGPALAALFACARRVVTTDPHDPRALEAAELGARVQTCSLEQIPELLASARQEALCA